MKGRALWPQSCKLSQFPNFIHRASSERRPTPRAEQQAEAATLTRPQDGNTGVGAYRVLGPEPRWKNNKRIRNTLTRSLLCQCCLWDPEHLPTDSTQVSQACSASTWTLHWYLWPTKFYPHSLHHQYIQPTQSLPTLSTPLVYPAYPISTHTLYTTSIS